MDPIPEEIKRFMDGNIESIEQLEILRILGENPDKEWNAADLVQAVQAQPKTGVLHVTALEGRGLLTTIGRGVDLFCQFGPKTPELGNMVNRLLQLYKHHPVTIIKLVYARGEDSLRAFADSFRIRKED